MIIAIDGPAGAGKTTVAGLVATELNFRYISSGNVYRAVTFSLLQEFGTDLLNIINTDSEQLIKVLNTFSIDVFGPSIKDKLLCEDDLHSEIVDSCVATLSSIPKLRYWVNNILQAVSTNQNIIIEGRDITTVVFPDAEVKIYLDASVESRVKRRRTQDGNKKNLADTRESLFNRDKIDREKSIGALRIASDAQYWDTSDLTISEVCERLKKLIYDVLKTRRR